MQDEKIKKSLIIESRLKLLSLALQHKDSDIVEVIVSKVLEQNDLDKQVVDIISNIEFNMILNLFEHSINEIAYNGVFEQCFQKYLNTFDKNIF